MKGKWRAEENGMKKAKKASRLLTEINLVVKSFKAF